MEKTFVSAACAVIAVLLLSGCDDTRRALGQSKDPPDEFAVFTRAPLSLPPDYNMRPPKPGAQRPQEINQRDQARRAVGGTSARQPITNRRAGRAAATSAGEAAILKRSGAANPDPNIRQLVDRETTFYAEEDKTFVDRVVFWGVKTEYGTIVDAKKEVKRINEKQALGKSLAEGKVPMIKRKTRAILEGIFD
jgi:hypothetical protein